MFYKGVGKSGGIPSTPLRVISGHSSRILNLGIYVENEQSIIVTTCKDFIIRFWDLTTGEILKSLSGHTSFINTMYVYTSPSSGSTLIVTGADKGNLRVWSTAGEVLRMVLTYCNYSSFIKLLNPDQVHFVNH
jgi:WD40 repeat protein